MDTNCFYRNNVSRVLSSWLLPERKLHPEWRRIGPGKETQESVCYHILREKWERLHAVGLKSQKVDRKKAFIMFSSSHTYAHILFMDFSTSLNTVIPDILFNRPRHPNSLCLWINDFLARPFTQHQHQFGIFSDCLHKVCEESRCHYYDQLSFTDQVSLMSWTWRFALYNIRKIKPYLSDYSTRISRLDYCSATMFCSRRIIYDTYEWVSF